MDFPPPPPPLSQGASGEVSRAFGETREHTEKTKNEEEEEDQEEEREGEKPTPKARGCREARQKEEEGVKKDRESQEEEEERNRGTAYQHSINGEAKQFLSSSSYSRETEVFLRHVFTPSFFLNVWEKKPWIWRRDEIPENPFINRRWISEVRKVFFFLSFISDKKPREKERKNSSFLYQLLFFFFFLTSLLLFFLSEIDPIVKLALFFLLFPSEPSPFYSFFSPLSFFFFLLLFFLFL